MIKNTNSNEKDDSSKPAIFESVIALIVFIIFCVIVRNLDQIESFRGINSINGVVCNEFNMAYYKSYTYFFWETYTPVINSRKEFMSCDEYERYKK